VVGLIFVPGSTWAFGCVLYEMLTGTRAFEGEDVSDTIATVLKTEPRWSALPPSAPASIRRLLRRSLERDRKSRLADAVSLRLDIDEALANAHTDGSPASAAAAHVSPGPAAWWRLAVAACLGAAAIAAIWGWNAARATPEPPSQVARLSVVPPESAAPRLAPANSRDLAITPDGLRIVYVSARSQGAQLFVRRLDALDVMPLGAGAFATNNLFLSPDGRWVGFNGDGGRLMKQPLSDGPALLVTTLNGPGRGAAWLEDGTIVFATADPTTGLWRVSAEGGTAVALTRPDAERQGGDHYWPDALPGSRGVLFTVSGSDGSRSIAVLDLRTGQYRVLGQGSDARYVHSGHIVYSVEGTLHASPFDLESLEISGAPIPVQATVLASALGAAQFDISDNGTLVYFSGSNTRSGR
jgi:eukaryotic-like serine/threonine-protein kinase